MKTALKVAASVGIAIVSFIVIGLITWFIIIYPNIGAPILLAIIGITMVAGLAYAVYILFFDDM